LVGEHSELIEQRSAPRASHARCRQPAISHHDADHQTVAAC
jgi:hypothetical protein